jgi:hypothetical protein
MRERKVSRFWCDHCNKSGGSRFHMIRHEKHCTKNPDRACRMCDQLGECVTPVPVMHDAMRAKGMTGLREASNGCPACMLTAVRLFPMVYPRPWPEKMSAEEEAAYQMQTDATALDYKAECSRFWEELPRDDHGY